MWATTLVTVLIVIFFAATILYYLIKDVKTAKGSQITSDLVFRRYNKKLEKMIKIFANQKLTEIFNEIKMVEVKAEKPNENLIYQNIENLDKIEDNNALLNEIKKEVKSKGMVQSRINLLKKNIELFDLSEFKCDSKHPKHKAILAFEENLKKVDIYDKFKTVMSATDCFSFGNVFMFLPSKVLKIDLDNIFAAEYIDYEKIGLKIWETNEDEIEFDGTYDLKDTEYKLPLSDDVNQKASVKRKNYVLSFTFNSLTYDVIQGEILKERQAEMDKLCKRKF